MIRMHVTKKEEYLSLVTYMINGYGFHKRKKKEGERNIVGEDINEEDNDD